MGKHFVRGYFTTENNIHRQSTQQIEALLGLQKGQMAEGARVWHLLREPGPGEFEFHGSTLFPGGEGLTPAGRAAVCAVPGAWQNRRLVKVETIRARDANVRNPPAMGTRAEQWELRSGIEIEGRLLGELRPGQVWWGGRP
jgi:hypothetical protein